MAAKDALLDGAPVRVEDGQKARHQMEKPHREGSRSTGGVESPAVIERLEKRRALGASEEKPVVAPSGSGAGKEVVELGRERGIRAHSPVTIPHSAFCIPHF